MIWKQGFEEVKRTEVDYQSLSKSTKKILLSWLKFAKTPETRLKRVTEIVTSAQQKQKPKHLR